MFTPYANVDMSALVHQGLTRNLATAYRTGDAVAGSMLPGTFEHNVAWPPGGTANLSLLTNLAATEHISTVVLNSSQMPPVNADAVFRPDDAVASIRVAGLPMNVLLSDNTLTGVLRAGNTSSGTLAKSTEFAVRQRFLAETAMIAAEAPDSRRTVVVAPPGGWSPSETLASDLLRETTTTPWLTPTQLTSLFEPFNRFGAENEGIEGTGIGLTIVKALVRSRTMLWVCVGGAAQVLVVSAIWSWLPSFLNREYGLAPDQAAVKAALVVLCGAIGSVLWGAVIDRAGARHPHAKLYAMALLCIASFLVVVAAFGAPQFGLEMSAPVRFALIAFGGFLMTCTVGPVTAIVIDVTHPAVRATSASVLALFLNLFGLAAGSFIAGVLSDAWGLTVALTVIPAFGLLAALAFLFAARTYEADMQRVGQPTDKPASTPIIGARNALA